jgi:hypothetical protein
VAAGRKEDNVNTKRAAFGILQKLRLGKALQKNLNSVGGDSSCRKQNSTFLTVSLRYWQ